MDREADLAARACIEIGMRGEEGVGFVSRGVGKAVDVVMSVAFGMGDADQRAEFVRDLGDKRAGVGLGDEADLDDHGVGVVRVDDGDARVGLHDATACRGACPTCRRRASRLAASPYIARLIASTRIPAASRSPGSRPSASADGHTVAQPAERALPVEQAFQLVADGEPAEVIASPVVQNAYLGVSSEEPA